MNDIIELYTKFGSHDYIGEQVSQIEHMTQAAMLAEKDNQSRDVILSCFLHDIGHLLGLRECERGLSGEFGTTNHERLGREYLESLGFRYPIPQLVEHHVSAKRYLVYKTPQYFENLSEASRQTLIQQGGGMSAEEAQRFEKDPLFQASLTMRAYDERAKVKHMAIKPEYYFNLIRCYLMHGT